MKNLLVLFVVGLFLVGCQASTPQASEEVKKQFIGHKPTAEELSAAMGSVNARIEKGRNASPK